MNQNHFGFWHNYLYTEVSIYFVFTTEAKQLGQLTRDCHVV